MFTVNYTIEKVKEYIESLGHYREVVFVKNQEGDCMYFDAIKPNGADVSIRADVEDEVSINKWNFYECCDEYDWDEISAIYK